MSAGKSSDTLSVLIVGCGNIAGGYDEASDDDIVRTHAKAYRRDGRFRLAGCVEPDDARRSAFVQRWGVEKAFRTLDEAAGSEYDVVSLCTPATAHAEQLWRLLDWPLRLVFAEKPLTLDIQESRRVVAAYGARGRPLAVNYQRRWDPSVQALKQEIDTGRWGRLLVANCIYTKGVLNNGTHLIDLLHYLLGALACEAVTEIVDDFTPTDPTLGAVLRTKEHAPVKLSAGDHRCFTVFELDMLFELGRVTLGDSGFSICTRPVIDDPRFERYRKLAAPVWHPTELDKALQGAVGNIHDHLAEGTPLQSTGVTALAAHEVCARLAAMAAS